MGIVELTKDKCARYFVSFVGQFSFILCNLAIFFILRNYLEVGFSKYYLFFIFSLISVLMVGFSSYMRGYFWCIGLFSLAVIPSLYVRIFIVFLIITSIFYVLVLNPKNISVFKEMAPEVNGVYDIVRYIKLFIYVFPRMIFFNSAYYLFPILFVWLITIGIMFHFRIYDFKIIPTSSAGFTFIEIVTIIGIIFGFFQFYLNRYSEIIQKKTIMSFSSLMSGIELLTFDDFVIYAESNRAKGGNSILSAIDDYVKSHVSTVRPGIKDRAFKLSSPEYSLKDFHDFEAYLWKNGANFDKLGMLYQSFFEFKIKEILHKKSNEANDFLWLLLGNISILTEHLPSMFSFNIEKSYRPRTYKECLEDAKLSLINTLFDEWINGDLQSDSK